LGIFVPKFKIIGMMGENFKVFKEEFFADETWNDLGKSTRNIETFKM
jgi:hypothetical protein